MHIIASNLVVPVNIDLFPVLFLITVSIPIKKVDCLQSNLLEESNNSDDCSILGTLCGGHSYASCNLFCARRGYSMGNCETSCCVCQHQSNANVEAHSREFSSDPFLEENYDTNNVHGEKRSICTSSACFKAAKQLRANMNPSVNACDNFYEFACGGFVHRTKIPSYQNRVTTFTLAEEKIENQIHRLLEKSLTRDEPKAFRLTKHFYQSCMNIDLLERLGMEPMRNVITNLGGWPLVSVEQWHHDSFHWTDSVIKFQRSGLPASHFMRFDVRPDVRNSIKRVITIGEPSLVLSADILLSGLKNPVVRAYYKYQIEMAILFGAYRHEAEQDMLEVLEFEISLASIFIPREERRHPNAFYNPMTISQLQIRYPSINWQIFLQKLFPSTVRLDVHENLIVQSPDFIEKFLLLIKATPTRTQANYAIWRAVESSSIYMNEASRRIYSEFVSMAGINTLSQSRSKECIETALSKMGNSIGAMYTRLHFREEIKIGAEEMVSDLRRVFTDVLNKAMWMDEGTRQRAKEKAWAMHSHVGYPHEHFDDRKLNDLLENVQLKEDSYLRNILALRHAEIDLEFARLRLPVNKTEWTSHGNSAVVNAFYHPQENSMQLPAGILQGSFFDVDRPRYLNYGSIGWIIGHEITHGFDIKGHQYDKNGDLQNWWAPDTKNIFESKTQCFVRQYGNYIVPDVKLKLNGVSSQGENVADNGGVKLAYNSYQRWIQRNGEENTLPGLNFTPNQLFWISAANNWCSKHRSESLSHVVTAGMHVPEEFRVIGAFSNSNEFSKDFKCSSSKYMNPKSKCSLW